MPKIKLTVNRVVGHNGFNHHQPAGTVLEVSDPEAYQYLARSAAILLHDDERPFTKKQTDQFLKRVGPKVAKATKSAAKKKADALAKANPEQALKDREAALLNRENELRRRLSDVEAREHALKQLADDPENPDEDDQDENESDSKGQTPNRPTPQNQESK